MSQSKSTRRSAQWNECSQTRHPTSQRDERKRFMKARVKVPASTSNLGAGFDCVGVAVDRWLSASVDVSESAHVEHVTVIRSGAVANLAETAEDDLLHLGFR